MEATQVWRSLLAGGRRLFWRSFLVLAVASLPGASEDRFTLDFSQRRSTQLRQKRAGFRMGHRNAAAKSRPVGHVGYRPSFFVPGIELGALIGQELNDVIIPSPSGTHE